MENSQVIDLSQRLAPRPDNVVVIEAPEPIGEIHRGDLVLVNTAQHPEDGDIILEGDSLAFYESGINCAGVAYCTIHFLNAIPV